jgi:hypothetical protein
MILAAAAARDAAATVPVLPAKVLSEGERLRRLLPIRQKVEHLVLVDL